MFRISRNTDRDTVPEVICESSMEVPEMPLSYSLTGARKTVTPNALTQPAMVSMRKLTGISPEKAEIHLG